MESNMFGLLAFFSLLILSSNTAQGRALPPRAFGRVPTLPDVALAPVSGHVNATSVVSGDKDLFTDALQKIADGFTDEIGIGIFSSMFEGPSPPKFREIVEGKNGVIQDAKTNQTIGNAEDYLDAEQQFVLHHWSVIINASVQNSSLPFNVERMKTEALSVFEKDNCTQGDSWSSYVLAGGLYLQELQEEKLRQIIEFSEFQEEAHQIASTALDCWTVKKNKRMEALKDSISHKSYKFTDKKKEIPDQSVQAKPDCMASGKHPRPWAECDRAVYVHDDMIDALENKLKASCNYAEALTVIQKWQNV